MSNEQKPKCWSNEASSGQYPTLTGAWEDSADERFEGFYDATEECPAYGHDFDCRRPHKGAGHEQAAHPCFQMLIHSVGKIENTTCQRDHVLSFLLLAASNASVLVVHRLEWDQAEGAAHLASMQDMLLRIGPACLWRWQSL